ncbi:unnamed protein product [Lactuca saligna]|uniref:Uncharacterized protein n=1 Tax=Lactuca saligna TaxID=75948 RepID=A0AA36A1I7_LACSI|nr:unnamed protein product [Lactuca saligna]
MNPGDKPFIITYLIGYALTNSHHSIDYKKEEYIELEDVFSEIEHVRDKQFCDINPQDSSWALNIAKNKKALGEKLSPTISIDSFHIGEMYKPQEPTLRDILKSIRTLRLLDLVEYKGNDTIKLEISTSKELKQLFHFDETINIIEETSIYISKEEVQSLSSNIEPNFGMNKTESHFDHPGESSFQGERRIRAKIEQGHRTGSMPDLPTGKPDQFGTNVLNIDNIETKRKEVID